MNKIVFVILGPTCTGKTFLALQLCTKFNGEILSSDSRQVVKYLDVGTGKIPGGLDFVIDKKNDCWKVNGIDIRGYDLIEPDKYFSGYDFLVYAREVINNMKDKKLFIVGGTGFYIDLVTDRAEVSGVKPDIDLRNRLENYTLEKLCRELEKLNKSKLQNIDQKNKNRLTRAIEIEYARSTHETNDFEEKTDKIEYKFIGLTTSRESLYLFADKWVDSIWGDLLLEVSKLKHLGFYDSFRLNGIIYKSAKSFMDNSLSENEARQQAKYDLHSYIRRQQTWFKRNHDIKWFDIQARGYRQNVEDFVELHCG
ncbi:hypothetical protein A3A69_00905 [candidate division WWE3 bacterium RIFCSPLOWO2_01_FULL_37_15]|uniref:Uncharacterized protein n=1 Tax=candidate division WWE3 bacterium RIFCSPLOWO2_01_FULL_37_15 TaxID=1802622 RepID=A0A1F4UT74_UNCKA|nr:MAG: hypothetical protein A3A69_00905 [candidate division WWE3 bacterium RIFCSPLOWO2_01_FULL_37_15]